MQQRIVSIVCTTILAIFSLTLGYISRKDYGDLLTFILFLVGIALAILVAVGIFSRGK